MVCGYLVMSLLVNIIPNLMWEKKELVLQKLNTEIHKQNAIVNNVNDCYHY